jgi:short-subunit dehydrogenase
MPDKNLNTTSEKRKVIIIGASSGIGRELAKVFSYHGFEVGITGRREQLLKEISAELKTKTYISSFDVANTQTAIPALESLIKQMGRVDFIIISAGVGSINEPLEWQYEKETDETNVLGFTAMANVSFKYFLQNGSGHLAAISSIAGLIGNSLAPAYSSSKAYISIYLKSLRNKALKTKKPIYVTDILPGFVRTAMAPGDNLFWVASPEKATLQIYEALIKKKRVAYITRRWALIAWLIKIMPSWILSKI